MLIAALIGLFFLLAMPIFRGLQPLPFKFQMLVTFLLGLIVVWGILVLNPKLNLPAFKEKSENNRFKSLINFVIYAVIPIGIASLWYNGELVNQNDRNIPLLIFLFSCSCIGAASWLSSLFQSIVSWDDNTSDEYDKDDLDYDGELNYCLSGSELTYSQMLRKEKIISRFYLYCKNNRLSQDVDNGKFIVVKVINYNEYYESLVGAFFLELQQNHNWPKKEREPLFELFNGNQIKNNVFKFIVDRLYQTMRDLRQNKRLSPQIIISMVILLETLYSQKSPQEMASSINERRNLLNFFVDGQQTGVTKNLHINRIRVFTTILISYFDYVSRSSIPHLSRKDDANILLQILDTFTKDQLTRFPRTEINDFLYGDKMRETIQIDDPEKDEKFGSVIDVALQQLMNKEIYSSPSPVSKNIHDIVDLDEIFHLLANWDDWS